MTFLTAVMASIVNNQGGANVLVLLGTIGCGLLVYGAYWFWQRRKAFSLLSKTPQALRIGVVTSLTDEAISPEIGTAFNGFMNETIEILAARMGSSAQIHKVAPEEVEQALNNNSLDFVIVDGNTALTFSSKIEIMPCYVSSLNALALIFWEKMPHHMMTLQDFAYYPGNGTGVLKNSLEEHYLAMFDTITIRRADTLTRLVVDLKLGLIRAGLVRMEQAKALKVDYAAIKFMPVSLQKRCFIQDEKIAVARTKKALIKDLEKHISLLRREGIMKKIHAKWFSTVRPVPPATLSEAVTAALEEQKREKQQ